MDVQTGGGGAIDGDVNTKGGNFAGRGDHPTGIGGGFTVNSGTADALQQVYYILLRIEAKQDAQSSTTAQHDRRLTALEVWSAAEAQRASRMPVMVEKLPINTFAIIALVGTIALFFLLMLLRGSGAL